MSATVGLRLVRLMLGASCCATRRLYPAQGAEGKLHWSDKIQFHLVIIFMLTVV